MALLVRELKKILEDVDDDARIVVHLAQVKESPIVANVTGIWTPSMSEPTFILVAHQTASQKSQPL